MDPRLRRATVTGKAADPSAPACAIAVSLPPEEASREASRRTWAATLTEADVTGAPPSGRAWGARRSEGGRRAALSGPTSRTKRVLAVTGSAAPVSPATVGATPVYPPRERTRGVEVVGQPLPQHRRRETPAG